MSRISSSLPIALCVAALAWAAAAAQPPKLDRAELRLEADRTSYAAGSTARLAAVVEIDDGWHVNSHQPTYEWLIATKLTLELPEGVSLQDGPVYPEGVLRRFAFEEEQPLSVYEERAVITAELGISEGLGDGELPVRATLLYQACDDRSCLPPTTATAALSLPVGAAGQPVAGSAFDQPRAERTGTSPPQPPGRGLLLLVLLGVAGGLILNAMPCVLPVLSLKLFGLVKSASQGRGQVVTGSLATAAGILVSFWALAGAAVAARAAGATVGWGVQFQEPVFVVFLAVVVLLFCLNLWGLFEIQLPAGLGRLGGTPREGLPGHFASGLFATLMATPCSAPFLGTALGFALGQSAWTVFGMFTAIGVGMGLPYLALALWPRILEWMPAPGAWMERLRGLMGFLLAGAAVWLLYVLSSQVSRERLAFVELALLVAALFVWTGSRARGRGMKRLAAAGLLASIAGSLWLAASADPASAAPAASTETERRISWAPFDREEAERLAAEEKRLVFVDVTADWCFTCKVNERLVLETRQIADTFERHGVIPMKADWTNRDPAIAGFLEDHGRYGIPFYLLYRPGDTPHLFPELLSKDGVIEVIEAAAR